MKRHLILPLIGLAASLTSAAFAAEAVYVPSLPAVPAIPLVRIPSLPSRIETIIPGQIPTRDLPASIRKMPSLWMPAPAVPVSYTPEAPSWEMKRKPVRYVPAVPGKLPAASLARLASASRKIEGLSRVFDNSRDQEAALREDDRDVVTIGKKGDPSHLTIPESDLENEIGIR